MNHDDDTCPHLVRANLLEAENASLKAEVERLTKESDIFEKCCEHQKNRIERLKAEVEELKLENSQYEEHHKYGQNVIASLREEVERLTKALEEEAACQVGHQENAILIGRLEAEVERLTKAGDAMAEDLLKEFGRKEMLKYQPYQDWNAAKEGKQP